VDGLLRGKTRMPGKAPIPAATVACVVALTYAAPSDEATHWTGRAMAKAVGHENHWRRQADERTA
jgi:hypothetical protein